MDHGRDSEPCKSTLVGDSPQRAGGKIVSSHRVVAVEVNRVRPLSISDATALQSAHRRKDSKEVTF